jgi:RNA polymerase sigma-70 factor, ECF subfamily
MTPLYQAVDDYLELRRGLGFKLREYGVCLRELVSVFGEQGIFSYYDQTGVGVSFPILIAVIRHWLCPLPLGDSGIGHARNCKSTVAKKINLQVIVSEHYAALYRFGFALAKNESDAADLTQETFLILAKRHEHIRDPEKIKCWLFTTLRREFLRRIRSHTVHPEVQSRPEEHEISTIKPSALRSIDAKLALAALEKVDESYPCLKLFYLGDLSYKEISLTLGVPIGTVMSRLSRGKEQLRRALGQRP